MLMVPDTLMKSFAQGFLSRTDDYALQQANGRYLRVGRPLTWRVLSAHLEGWHTLGTYVMDAAGMCRYAVFDADSADGLDVLATLSTRLAADGIPSLLEASRRGGHLWVLFSGRYLASVVRCWLLPYCPAGVEFYPKQDEGCGYGSLIRLPLGVHRRSGCWYPFLLWQQDQLVPVAETRDDMLQWLAMCERVEVPAPALVAAPAAIAAHSTLTHTPIVSHTTPHPTSPASRHRIHAWCASQNPFAVIGRYIRLDQHGLGCCPFGEHHRDGRDSHPSFRVYAPRSASGSCWYCYTAGSGGTLFDFLLRYYRLDVPTLWAAVQAGRLP